jgi:DNA-directed RNA polymerase subunit RPC12/RpoP
MTWTPSKYSRLLLLVVLSLFAVISILGLSVLADTVQIGSNGGGVSVESDLDLLFNNGGGHVTWRISGQAAPEMRRLIDKNFGNNDGSLTPAEAAQYTSALDNTLTLSGATYQGAKLTSFSLLNRNRGIEDNSNFLIGQNNDTRTIEIRFLLEATASTVSDKYSLSDDLMVKALFDSLRTTYDNNTYVFVGHVDITHTNYIIGMSSYSSFSVDHGRAIRFRGPIWEIYQYTVSYDKGTMDNAKDTANFDTFNVFESPLELFILLAIVTYLLFYLPRRLAKSGRKQRMRSFHRGIFGLVVLLFAVYMLGVAGPIVWFLTILIFILIVLFAYRFYIQGWKGLAKPLSLAESKDLDREEGLIRPESYRKIQAQRYAEEEGEDIPYESPRDRPRPSPPRRPPPARAGPPPDYDEGPAYSEDEGGPLEEAPPPPPRRPAVRPPAQPPAQRPAPRPQAPKPIQKPAQRPAPTTPPGPPITSKKIRCVQCKEIFTAEIRTKPQRVECPICGKVGMIK